MPTKMLKQIFYSNDSGNGNKLRLRDTNNTFRRVFYNVTLSPKNGLSKFKFSSYFYPGKWFILQSRVEYNDEKSLKL